MITALGGPSSFLKTYKTDINNNCLKEDIFINEQGFIKEIKTRELGLLLIELGGGRKQTTDQINYNVGYDAYLKYILLL